MNNWTQIAQNLWQAVLAKVKALKAEDETLQAIADKVGVNHRSVVGEWIKGNRQAANAPMGDLMTYAERLGIDYRNYFPGGEPPVQETASDCATCRKLLAKEKENQKLQKENERLKLELAGAQGEVRALERQLDRRESAEQADKYAPEGRRAAG